MPDIQLSGVSSVVTADARTAAACTGSRGVAGALMRQSKRPRSAASQWSASPAKPHVAIHADNGCNGLEPERADLASGTPPSGVLSPHVPCYPRPLSFPPGPLCF